MTVWVNILRMWKTAGYRDFITPASHFVCTILNEQKKWWEKKERAVSSSQCALRAVSQTYHWMWSDTMGTSWILIFGCFGPQLEQLPVTCCALLSSTTGQALIRCQAQAHCQRLEVWWLLSKSKLRSASRWHCDFKIVQHYLCAVCDHWESLT